MNEDEKAVCKSLLDKARAATDVGEIYSAMNAYTLTLNAIARRIHVEKLMEEE